MGIGLRHEPAETVLTPGLSGEKVGGTLCDTAGVPLAPRPTLEDVAARAGVGRGTASRALSGSTGVRESTRTAVLAAARDLGYRPNAAARSLVTRRTGMVTLALWEPIDRMFTDPFLADTVRGLGRVLRQHDHRLVLLPLEADDDPTDALDYLRDGHTDGVVVVSSHGPHDLGTALAGRDVPVVRIGRALHDDGLPWVDVDNLTGGRLAAEHLLDRGCRSPAHVTGVLETHAGWARRQGYRVALRAAAGHVAPREVEGDFSWESGRAGAQVVMSRWPDTDGIFAASDAAATGVLAGLADLGVAVPGQVRVVGFDDSPLSWASSPRLSTIHQPIAELGERAGRRLLEVLGIAGVTTSGSDAAQLLPVRLVERAST